jgi:hypothetical protein
MDKLRGMRSLCIFMKSHVVIASMFTKAEKVFAGALVIACAILGIIGYSSPSSSDPPSKIWFDTGGGDVIFDHDYHVSFSECNDCHHGYDEEGEAPDFEMNCRACHYYGEESKTPSGDETHVHYIGANCIHCHEDMSMEVSCDSCHIRQGYAFEASGSVMPPLPESVLFDTDNGEVIFDHPFHLSEDIGEPCSSCHHTYLETEGMEGMRREKRCRACHYDLSDLIPEYDDEYHMRYIGVNCAECHDAEDCGTCHEE